MAFVILSAGTVTRSKMRTVSIKSFLGLVLASLLLVLAGGFALGYSFSGDGNSVVPLASASAADVVDQPAEVDTAALANHEGAPLATIDSPPLAPEIDGDAPLEDTATAEPVETVRSENRYLIDRFGELSGRMIQLEAEAMELAARIGAIQEFEARINADELEADPKGRVAKTPPGAPAGGPLLRPLDAAGEHTGSNGAAVQVVPLSDELSRMESDVERLADALSEVDRIATGYKLAHMSFPGRRPVFDVPMTSGFGNRADPFTKRRAFHSGIDYPAAHGTPIHASAGGRVIFAGNRSHYGHTVEIDHGAGLVTRYAHASKLLVKKGQVVLPGEKIAQIGSTGRSTGPHLHFEILRDGRFVDPSMYLARF